jgi:outer membrane lipoprotein-sorting protein
MKTLLTIAIVLIITMAAKAQSSPAADLANRIAQKMKDTLDLSAQQKTQIYTINMQLHYRKMSFRQQYAGTDSVRFYLQRVENTRDSLYHGVLSDEKYLLYQGKKINLVTSN